MRRQAILVFAAGLAIRLIVAVAFWGSRDVTIQIHHGERILRNESAWTTKLPVAYFLPPLMTLVSKVTGIPAYVTQKFPAIAGDILTALLLMKLATRTQNASPVRWAAVYLLNPLTVMLSAYHGNVDPLMAAAMLWALDLRWRDKPLAGGAALGLAIAMKPTAIIVLPVLMLPLERRPSSRVAAGALLVPSALCAPFLLLDRTFGRFLLGYSATFGAWGIPLLTRQAENIGRQSGILPPVLLHAIAQLNEWMIAWGRYVLLVLLCVWFVYVARRWNSTTLEASALAVAASYLFFYVFATGFGAQYLSLAVPFLLVVSVRMTMIYVAGLTPYLLTNYMHATLYDRYGGIGAAPLTSRLSSLGRGGIALLALSGVMTIVAWATCAWLLWQITRLRTRLLH